MPVTGELVNTYYTFPRMPPYGQTKVGKKEGGASEPEISNSCQFR